VGPAIDSRWVGIFDIVLLRSEQKSALISEIRGFNLVLIRGLESLGCSQGLRWFNMWFQVGIAFQGLCDILVKEALWYHLEGCGSS